MTTRVTSAYLYLIENNARRRTIYEYAMNYLHNNSLFILFKFKMFTSVYTP